MPPAFCQNLSEQKSGHVGLSEFPASRELAALSATRTSARTTARPQDEIETTA